MNPSTQKEAVDLFDKVKDGIEGISNVEIVICPPLVYISSFKSHVSGLKLGAQNVFYPPARAGKKEGAYTGEVSPIQLKNLSVEYVIVGHSESRRDLHETDELINKKIKECLKEGLRPILCIGEKEGENKEKVFENQLKRGLEGISRKDVKNVIIAYEPIWAIGTGNNCSIGETIKSVLLIKKNIHELYGKEVALEILYGGSVKSKNSGDYLKSSGVDGLLVGGASLDAEEFTNIVKSVE